LDFPTILSGEIALIVNLYEYQNIVFDTNGVIGHSWITEPDRPWMDALGRGMLGAADIGLKLQSPNVSNDENTEIPLVSSLSCYPNPFSSQLSIEYTLPKDTETSLAVYNIRGQKVRTLFTGNKAKGSYSISWNGESDGNQMLANGMYFVRLMSNDGKSKAMKVILLR
jgi:hypothetical protein